MTNPDSKILSRIAFRDIPGWNEDDHDAALLAFRNSAAEILRKGSGFERPVRFGGERRDWVSLCELANSTADGRAFFESSFVPYLVADPLRPEGLFTGYYEPEADGSRQKSDIYVAPVLRAPDDLAAFNDSEQAATGLKFGRLVDSKPRDYFTRREIDDGALAGRGLEIVWLKDWADLFFMQVQGSGRIRLPDGSVVRLGFAAKSGHPYTAIGGILVSRGLLSQEEVSMQSIRDWMSLHPAAARELMWHNRSYVFFREMEGLDPALGPPGAQKVTLTPGRSLAIDRELWMFGTPVWVDTRRQESPHGESQPFRHLLIAHDTGSAIRGYARGDIFCGHGSEAAFIAGHLKSPGTMIVLLPNQMAELIPGAR